MATIKSTRGYMEEFTPQGRRPSRQPATLGSSSAGVAAVGNSCGHQLKRRPKRIRLDRKLLQFCYSKWNLSHILPSAAFLLVAFLLYDGHHKTNLIANRLKEFKSEEAMLFLHLHRIEQQSLQLHQALQRLDTGTQVDPAAKKGEYLPDPGHPSPPNTIDAALLQKHTQQLVQMEQEITNKVSTLHTRMQHSAVGSIVHEYGEGPVQVVWEVVVDGQTSKISILLWHDTPYAAWTWLEQISRKLWDGALLHLENNRLLGISRSTHDDSEGADARLDFLERSQQRHTAWTIGLSDATQDSTNNNGGLQVFINLQDNTEFSKHNVCIGKVFDGFDVLHKMVEQTRQMQLGGQQAPLQPISIKTVRAFHLTNRETRGLI